MSTKAKDELEVQTDTEEKPMAETLLEQYAQKLEALEQKLTEVSQPADQTQTQYEEKLAELEKKLAALSKTEDEPKEERDERLDEKVTVKLFRDSGKYNRDLTVGVNGKLWKIKRGMEVQVPRYVALAIAASMRQDADTAALIEQTDGTYVQYANL